MFEMYPSEGWVLRSDTRSAIVIRQEGGEERRGGLPIAVLA